MRPPRVVATAALCGAMGLAVPARAQHVEGRASLSAGVAYNKTSSDASTPTAQTLAGPSFTVGPQGVLVYDTPRTSSTLTYAFTLALPLTSSLQASTGPLAYSNHLTYSGRYELSEVSSLTFTFTLNHSPLHALALAGDSTQIAFDAAPTDASYMLSMSGQQGFTRQLTEKLSLTQSAGLTFTNPIDPTVPVVARTFAGSASLGLNRQFDADTLGLQLAVMTSYFPPSQLAVNTNPTEARTQIADTLSLTWSRPLTQLLSMSLQLGATQVITPTRTDPNQSLTAVEPTGNATLNYNLDPAVLTLNYAHMAMPNLLTNSVNFTDSGTVRFSMPLGQTGLLATGSGGLTHMTPIGTTDVSSTNVILADATLTWKPERVPTLSLSARGQVQRQTGGQGPGGVAGSGNLTRLSTSLNLTYSYPSANAAQFTPTLPPALGASPYVPGGGADAPDRAFDVPAEVPEATPPASKP